MKFAYLICLIAVFAFLVAPFSFAISVGVSPGIGVLAYSPDISTYAGSFQVINSQDDEGIITVNASSDVINITSPQNLDLPARGMATVNYTVTLPPDYPPGNSRLMILVKVAPRGSGQMGVAVAVNYVIKIAKPYPNDYGEIKSFTITQQDNNVTFDIEFFNFGSTVLDPTAQVTIGDETGAQIAILKNSSANLQPEGTQHYTMEWNGKPGKYIANAVVSYASTQTPVTSQNFSIGEKTLKIDNLPANITKGGIQKTDIEVESIWNLPIDATAYIIISKNGTAVAESSKSALTEIPPWGKENVEMFIDTTGLEVGTYPLDAIVEYEGKNATLSGFVSIVEPKNETPAQPAPAPAAQTTTAQESPLTPLVAALLVILIIVVIGAAVMLRKKKTGEDEETNTATKKKKK